MVATVDAQTTAQAYLELLYDRGIECFFANAGSDFAPLIDAFARFAAQGKPAPQPITVPHENAAVAMASGYYLVTGRPQAVMVHVNVGTANALSGIINAARDHIPILVTAGRTPINEAGFPGARDSFIQWAQESFDQAAMVREYVKMDMVRLEEGARLILTDSGGVQKEAYWLRVPCVTLRKETEWVETVEAGWNTLAGTDTHQVVEAVRAATPGACHPLLYGDGKAAQRVAECLLNAS